jgi:hypothetical protein
VLKRIIVTAIDRPDRNPRFWKSLAYSANQIIAWVNAKTDGHVAFVAKRATDGGYATGVTLWPITPPMFFAIL